jgi:hypothetical protein
VSERERQRDAHTHTHTLTNLEKEIEKETHKHTNLEKDIERERKPKNSFHELCHNSAVSFHATIQFYFIETEFSFTVSTAFWIMASL